MSVDFRVLAALWFRRRAKAHELFRYWQELEKLGHP